MASKDCLKQSPPNLKPATVDSTKLIRTPYPPTLDPRTHYLTNPTIVPAPVISSSSFIPKCLITHLMRRKKNSALAVKFKALSGTDEITNMEGALHTFVTPVVPIFMHGDYRFDRGHGVVRFPDVEVESDENIVTKTGKKKMVQQAREVVLSASVQMDFEGRGVMLTVCALSETQFDGRPLPKDFDILSVTRKQDDKVRRAYDEILRQHMVYHLTASHNLPAIDNVTDRIVDRSEAARMLEAQILAPDPDYEVIRNTFARLPSKAVISLELLFNAAVEQLKNEISALEALCPYGYILTMDPASIFAQEIGASFLNRISFAALRYLADGCVRDDWGWNGMKGFGFNDYADGWAVGLLKSALRRQDHVSVVAKSALFPQPRGIYVPLEGMEGVALVIHNNSDGFGQNVETEWESGSLDGAIGVNSSAAASLLRTRDDLLDFLM